MIVVIMIHMIIIIMTIIVVIIITVVVVVGIKRIHTFQKCCDC